MSVVQNCTQGEDNFKKERFVLSVAYSPDGKRLACGSMDGTVGVFDTDSGKLLHTLDGHFKPVRALTFTPGKSPNPHQPVPLSYMCL
jgi:WD repeat-containing protein 61